MNKIIKHKRIIGSLILALYLLSSFKVISPYINYNLNQEYIINVLCVNKDKIELKCEGSCFLANELKKASEESKETEKSLNFKIQVELLNIDEGFHLADQHYIITGTSFTFHNNLWNNIPFEIEAPPPKP